MKVVLHFAAGPVLREALAALTGQGVEVACCPEGVPEPFTTEMRDAQAIWHVLQPITPEVIANAPRLRLIQKIGVGVNTIDLHAAQARGIAVCNMPGSNSRAVAEMSLMLMLNALRRQYGVERSLRAGEWTVDEATRESIGELCGRTVGIVGFGAVPQVLAPILHAMGARVVYSARSRRDVPWEYFDLDRLFAESDVVTLHVPLTPETAGLASRERIASMKRGAILVNTARGGLVDEPALIEALASGRLGAAGLDVFAEEPLAADHPLLALPNVTVAPHVAWLTRETWQRSISIALHNTLAVRDGTALLHRVA